MAIEIISLSIGTGPGLNSRPWNAVKQVTNCATQHGRMESNKIGHARVTKDGYLYSETCLKRPP